MERAPAKNPLLDIDEDVIQSANARHIDSLPTSSHVVFVTEKNYKRFGYFVGTNGFGAAIISFDDRRDTIIISATAAISM